MKFKDLDQSSPAYKDIESLFADIRTNKTINSLYFHQAQILKLYEKEYLNTQNLALELPTGTGKTLIGLLIAEFNRSTLNKKVVYACSTKQLVNQVVNNSNNHYGIKATAFIGGRENIATKEFLEYTMAQTIAVTTYSMIFNVNPYFQDADIIIFDDAHVAENYVASNWSVQIDRESEFYQPLLKLIGSCLEYSEYNQLSGNSSEKIDHSNVQILPIHSVLGKLNQVCDFFDAQLKKEEHKDIFYPWLNIRKQLEACQFYVSYNMFLIRPIIPPAMTNVAFRNAKQRIYMSATLGTGGDLERMFGVNKIERIPMPELYKQKAQGTRFFMFPDLSLTEEEKRSLFIEMNKLFNRSLTLVPFGDKSIEMREIIEKDLKFKFFDARDIEQSKENFTHTENAAMVAANRYEGIDFEGDDCRLLFLINLPKTINLQETFILQRLGSFIVIHDRIKTRLVQAIGRCTRSASDYACVVILGKDITSQLVSPSFQEYFHPELQAELWFGMGQSKDSSLSTLLEYAKTFQDQGEDWSRATKSIYFKREQLNEQSIPGTKQLEESVIHEVNYQYHLWHKNYKEAVNEAQKVINDIAGGKELNGYRAFWNYLASATCYTTANKLGAEEYIQRSQDYINSAAGCTPSITWMRTLIEDLKKGNSTGSLNLELASNIERLDTIFEDLGVPTTTKFEKELEAVVELINSENPSSFELGNKKLGELLGFVSQKPKGSAAPDCYWICGNICIVFEDNSECKNNIVSIKKVKQSSDHTKWIKAYFTTEESLKIYSVVISSGNVLDPEATPFLDDTFFVPIEEFRSWAKVAIECVRKARSNYSPGNTSWRESAIVEFNNSKLAPQNVISFLTGTKLKDIPLKS